MNMFCLSEYDLLVTNYSRWTQFIHFSFTVCCDTCWINFMVILFTKWTYIITSVGCQLEALSVVRTLAITLTCVSIIFREGSIILNALMYGRSRNGTGV